MDDNENFDGLTFTPEEFIMRFAPHSMDEEQTPPKHSPAWAFTLGDGINGIIFAPTEIEAITRLTEEYENALETLRLFMIDDDQDIIEIK